MNLLRAAAFVLAAPVPSGRKAAFPVVDLTDWCRRHAPREPAPAPKREKTRTVELTGADLRRDSGRQA